MVRYAYVKQNKRRKIDNKAFLCRIAKIKDLGTF
jgi:hypothetical protein